MLDSETKRRIDTARDILVGKVPDPKGQVQQITIALIYKFMDDMDADSEEMGGTRKFFAGEFGRYGWAKLMRSGLGGHETLNLYAESISKMPENQGIPPLFREIFKDAFLPYRDPETLRSFLKIIDEFEYDHSERLGDAFEYLLSVLGSQGEAGQFRTPRHIIDFIVEVVDPKKTESVLDPACGTGGFLISSHKHILKSNKDAEGNSTLTPDDRARLAANFKGYDISPDMVRLSLANMYLHGFTDPHIHEYDTLTSQERWNEYADVILANPPFMSPKGGIRPHNRFSIQSKRSEVLFVDYMAEHLTSAGRAGIVVPEGIVSQGQTAYCRLRKMLVDKYLVAVVSLPSGVFNPYSGVKTSILILDRAIARTSEVVAFFTVANDGFGLGDQRRPIDDNDLPQARRELIDFLGRLRRRDSLSDFRPTLGHIVSKETIAKGARFALSGERYRASPGRQSAFPLMSIGDVAQVIPGQSPPGESYNTAGEGEPFYQGKADFGVVLLGAPTKWTTKPQRFAASGDTLMSVRAPVGPVNLATQRVCIGRGLAAIRPNEKVLLPRFAFYVLRSMEKQITGDPGAAFAAINRGDIERIQIPVPPLDVQLEMLKDIERCQGVIEGARSIVEHYQPRFEVDPRWPVASVGEVATLLSGGTPSKANSSYWKGDIPWVSAKDLKSNRLCDAELHISSDALSESATQLVASGAVLVLVRGMGLANGVPVCEVARPCAFNQDIKALVPQGETILGGYLALALRQEQSQLMRARDTAAHGTLKISTEDLRAIRIPLPPLAAQEAIVVRMEAEQRTVDATQSLAESTEKHLRALLAPLECAGSNGIVERRDHADSASS